MTEGTVAMYNPWQPIDTAPTDGTQCELRFRDVLGVFEALGGHFLHDDGHWYRVDPPVLIAGKPTHWRYFMVNSDGT